MRLSTGSCNGAVPEKDSVHLGFGFQVPGGTARMETPWAVVRPNVDQLSGACRNWFTNHMADQPGVTMVRAEF
ncbi:MAG: hypothetical protein KJ072_21445 [Verrucomicrobia bacterium]|nr:hypothetical protein [Verrucomicrobiota bacterium]